jgi:hypothetical protein
MKHLRRVAEHPLIGPPTGASSRRAPWKRIPKPAARRNEFCRGGAIADINVTPMADVMIVL